MRYRPFGRTGAAVSALSLALSDGAERSDDPVQLIYAALEAGVNTFEIQGSDPDLAAAVGEALSAVERQMVFVSLRVGWTHDRSGARVRDLSPEGLILAIDNFLGRSGLQRLDVVMLDLVEGEDLPGHVIPTLTAARNARRTRMIGMAGAAGADPLIETGAFDVLATPFNVQCGWQERNRLRGATQAEMAVIGCDYFPKGLGGGGPVEASAPAPTGLGRFFARREAPTRPPKAYDFLEFTNNWTPEQICLGFALTEPALATVQTCTTDIGVLEGLAAVPERELPTGLSAQIEMARISNDQETAALAKRRSGA